ncbi:ATP-dependent nuclease, partial [Rodentibacter pneumotropicus]
LMGESLEDILKSKITESTIREINGNLDRFISDLESELDGYVYKTVQHRQSKVKRSDIYKLIIDTYFNVRKLHKKIKDDQTIPMSEMSSGEKQKAIIDVAHSLLKNHRVDGKNLILGIDEPEASLHISACFDQFNSLFDIGNDCRQVLFTSHWYGYLPILNNGNTCIISKIDSSHHFDLINTSNYQEQMSQQKEESKGRLPYDIQLKSTTDFVQSILINIFSDTPYNWIICEGSSEKIYLERYFENEINLNKLRIVPVGGAKKIKKIYSNMLTPYSEMKDSIGKNIKRGKILLLSDTDRSLVNYKVDSDEFFKCQRIVNNPRSQETMMVNIHENPISPETEIEDCLNGKLFVDTLKYFKDEFPIIDFIDENKDYMELASSFSLDLRPSEQSNLKNFFDSNDGEMKLQFAKKYVELLSDSYSVPRWIEDIKIWICT